MSDVAGVITIDVDCPWCPAKAGEPCHESPLRLRSVRPGYAHLARVAPVDQGPVCESCGRLGGNHDVLCYNAAKANRHA